MCYIREEFWKVAPTLEVGGVRNVILRAIDDYPLCGNSDC